MKSKKNAEQKMMKRRKCYRRKPWLFYTTLGWWSLCQNFKNLK